MTVQRSPVYSIADFLTDGSLPRLAAALSDLAGTPVKLFGRRGERVEPADGSPPWRIATCHADASPAPGDDATEIHDADIVHVIERSDEFDIVADVPGRGELVLLHVGGACIGGLLVESAGRAEQDDEFARRLRVVAAHIAATVSERCSEEAILRERNTELSLLFRLSSLLVAVQDLDETLDVALGACLQILAADAGAVHLVERDDRRLIRHADAGLSTEFLDAFDSLEAPRAADPEALRGGVLAVADIVQHAGPDSPLARAARREGLRSMLSCGIVFKERPLGVLRLFNRQPTKFTAADQALMRSLAEQISAAVEAARLAELNRRSRAIRRQVKLASDVQRRLLPDDLPDHPAFTLAARYVPSSDLGGDFYDIIDLGPRLGLVLGDVVGKGVPAALLMASVRASLRAHAQMLGDAHAVEAVVARVNRSLARDTRPNEFATGFFGALDAETLQLTYSNAGHDPPFIVRAGRDDQHAIEELRVGGPLMGVAEQAEYQRGVCTIERGDALVAYTDGVCDAMNFDGEKFGRQRLKAAVGHELRERPDADADAIADRIIWDLRRFTGLNTERDDLSLLVLRARR